MWKIMMQRVCTNSWYALRMCVFFLLFKVFFIKFNVSDSDFQDIMMKTSVWSQKNQMEEKSNQNHRGKWRKTQVLQKQSITVTLRWHCQPKSTEVLSVTTLCWV